MTGTVLGCTASALAGVAGYAAWMWVEQLRRRARHREAVRQGSSSTTDGARGVAAPDERIISFMQRESLASQMRLGAWEVPDALMRSAWLQRNARFSGVAGSITEAGFCMARAKLAAGSCLLGIAMGCMLSPGMAMALGVAGMALGFTMPRRALGHRIERRTAEMERHLPEMLDVVAIGMRSGLSFDRSLQIYADRFPTYLASEFARAQREWTSGLERRDEALRRLAASYDSTIFARVTESIIRALRFGTSMVEGLEAAAREARVSYRTLRQERIAKAPVKMMIPTGTLILPAMLIMVLGPVLLELIGGGI